MKVQLVRDDIEVARNVETTDQMTTRHVLRNGRETPVRFFLAGAIIEDPEAYRLVQMGIAIPVDEEAAAAANMTPEKMAKAKHAYARLQAGIHPDDFEKFDRKQILGYNGDGSFIPGPNFHEIENDLKRDPAEDNPPMI